MIDRTVQYYQTPTAPGFARHMIEDTGLSPEQQAMAWDLRHLTGNTEFYADRAKLPLKRYNATMARIHPRMIAELIRLAQIGWVVEQNRKD